MKALTKALTKEIVFMKKTRGFTLFEMLVGIAIMGIVTAIALPNFSEFLVKMRVDSEISQINRLFQAARNGAINTEQIVTVCPLNASNVCENDWSGAITVFTDLNGNGVFEAGSNEEKLKVKDANTSEDSILYNYSRVSYSPNGMLNGFFNGTLRYCPESNDKYSRAIIVSSASGRTYLSQDEDHDGIDENRSGDVITCISS